MAPLRGVTDYIFRNVFTDFFGGFDTAMAPFVPTVRGKIVKQSYIRDILPENNAKLMLIPQLIGKNPEEFVVLACQLGDMGYPVVNWNLGCPFPQVANKQRGAGLLPYRDIIASFLDYTIPRINCKLSIKTRLGLVGNDDLPALLPIFNTYPLAELIIHPRTAKQMYTGNPDLDAFATVRGLSRHPVMYNGDITTCMGFKRLQERFPDITSWMIGRGAVINPFLTDEIKNGTAVAYDKQRLCNFLEALYDNYLLVMDNHINVLDKMKGIWFYTSGLFVQHHKVLKRIQKTKNLEGYYKEVSKVFESESLIDIAH
jgi:tRNA-dihydrouridine synthase